MQNSRPTRAEAADVANAILDGTDCVMLSGESAIGKYPEESVSMLAKIAAYTETHRAPPRLEHPRPATPSDTIASVVDDAIKTVPCAAVFVPTRTGATARMISRFSPPMWIVALSRDPLVCQGLVFSHGVEPIHLTEHPHSWRDYAQSWLKENEIPGTIAMLVAGPSPRHPDANYRIEFLRVGAAGT